VKLLALALRVTPTATRLVKLRVSPTVETLGVSIARNANGYALGVKLKVKPIAPYANSYELTTSKN